MAACKQEQEVDNVMIKYDGEKKSPKQTGH